MWFCKFLNFMCKIDVKQSCWHHVMCGDLRNEKTRPCQNCLRIYSASSKKYFFIRSYKHSQELYNFQFSVWRSWMLYRLPSFSGFSFQLYRSQLQFAVSPENCPGFTWEPVQVAIQHAWHASTWNFSGFGNWYQVTPLIQVHKDKSGSIQQHIQENLYRTLEIAQNKNVSLSLDHDQAQ
jgi:hypothetical protein